MIIEVSTKPLLNLLYKLSKVSKDGKTKGIRVESEGEGIHLYASNSMVFSDGFIYARVIEQGVGIIPLTILPILSPITEDSIILVIDEAEISIKGDKINVDLPQLSNDVDSISKRDYLPYWQNTNLSRLKDIRYAAGDPSHGLDVIYFAADKAITTDRFRTATYRLNTNFEKPFGILGTALQYIDDVEKIAVHDAIWLGSSLLNISLPMVILELYPVIARVSELKLDKFIEVNKDEFKSKVEICYRLSDDKVSSSVRTEGGLIYTSIKTSKGIDDSFTDGLRVSLDIPIDIDVNIKYLFEALSNCNGPNIRIGVIQLESTPIFLIEDGDITHSILPLRRV